MEINIRPVEGSDVDVSTLVSELRTLAPGTYACGSDTQNVINKYRSALAAKGYISKASKGAEMGTRTAAKGAKAGEQIPVYGYELVVTVRGAEGEDEPALPEAKPRAPKAEANGSTSQPAEDQPTPKAKAGR